VVPPSALFRLRGRSKKGPRISPKTASFFFPWTTFLRPGQYAGDCIFPSARYLTRRMRFSRLLFLLLLPLILTGGQVQAQLKWEHPIEEFHRVPDDKEIYAHYAFQNIGTTPVTIKSLRPSCGCTSVHLDKKTYAPGEFGDVTLHLVFGDRKGFYRKTVSVTTDDKPTEPVVLNMLITIHDPVTITPALVLWKTGQPAAAQSVQLSVDSTEHVHVKSVTSSNPRLLAKLEPGKPGEPYVITVQPADTNQKESAEISVQTDFPADSPHVYTIHARIK